MIGLPVAVGVDASSKGMRLGLTVGDLCQFKEREIKHRLGLTDGVDASSKGRRLGLTVGGHYQFEGWTAIQG